MIIAIAIYGKKMWHDHSVAIADDYEVAIGAIFNFNFPFQVSVSIGYYTSQCQPQNNYNHPPPMGQSMTT